MGSTIGCFGCYASKEAKNTLQILLSSPGMPKWTRYKFYYKICDNSKSIYTLTWERKNEYIDVYIMSDGTAKLRCQYWSYNYFYIGSLISSQSIDDVIGKLKDIRKHI